MQLLLITNLFPPQELGGYGRSMADFAWGLEQRGHWLTVLCSDAPYLKQPNSDVNIRANVNRSLRLKGDFRNGVHHTRDIQTRNAIDKKNREILHYQLRENDFDGILLGNLDLLGPEILSTLKNLTLPILHHIGYVSPPFDKDSRPKEMNYHMVGASIAVRKALIKYTKETNHSIPVVYPGARCDLFSQRTARSLPAPLGLGGGTTERLGSNSSPLKVCFAGLLMSSKGVHTVVQALLILKKQGFRMELSIAGGEFQKSYCNAIRSFIQENDIANDVFWYGQLSRPQLARFFRLHHAAVFPSIQPEAFGIVAAEAMASGLILLSSGVGGACELFEDGKSGLGFKANDPESLASRLIQITQTPPQDLQRLAYNGQKRVEKEFSVSSAAAKLEYLFYELTNE